jgi:hypothetical protein
MTIVQQVLGHHVTFGGEPHSGWLPQGATMPRPTPARDVALNITIEFDGFDYLLCWVSTDNDVHGDLWYQTLEGAEQKALEDFGVRSDQWQKIA